MKKLFSIILTCALVLTLMACENELTFTFTVDTEDESLSETVTVDDSSDLNAFDLVENTFDLEYQESDEGVFIESIASLGAPEGSYIAISKNDEPIESSLSDVTLEDGDALHFERQWYDETLRLTYLLDQSLDRLVDTHLDALVESGNIQAALALHHLGHDEALEGMNVPELGENPTDGALIQHIIISELSGEDASQDRADLADQASTDYPYSAALSYFALATGDVVDPDFEAGFMTMADGLDIDRTDEDSLSMVLAALGVMDDSDYDSLEGDILTHLEDNLYAESSGENDPGVNAAGLASALTALVSVGEDPASDAFFHEGESLVGNLLAFQSEDGAFLYKLDDDDADMQFSTPQAFLALAAYKASLTDDSFTHPFRVE